MTKTRVAINGFGRIGRAVLKAGFANQQIEFVLINDLGNIKNLAHLLKYDSIFGKFSLNVNINDDNLLVGEKQIKVFNCYDPLDLPLNDLDIDILIECTGQHTTLEKASSHLTAGAKKVIVSAPIKDSKAKTIVYGVNENEISKDDKIISNASCTTNCLAPICKIIHENFKIINGFINTIHAYTSDQSLQDRPHKDLRRSRAAAENIIPTSTGAAKAIGRVIKDLDGKLDGLATRIPVANGSLLDMTLNIEKHTSVDQINNIVKSESNKNFKNIIEYSDEPLVSKDIIGNTHSAIFDSKLTFVNKNLIKLNAWYDNEFGYSTRIIDLVNYISKF